MMLRSARLLPLGAVLALAGCASDPISYYTLAPADPPKAVASAPAGAPLVEILSVNVPPQIDLPQVVVRTGTGQVESLDGDRWVGPLPDEFRGALAQALSAEMGTPAIQGLRPDAKTPVWRVQVDIQRFETLSGEAVELGAVWKARLSPADRATPVCRSNLRESVGSGVAAAVEGHQRNVAVLASQIANTLKAGVAAAPRCPAQKVQPVG